MKISKEGYKPIGITFAGTVIIAGITALLAVTTNMPSWPVWIIGALLLYILCFVIFFFRAPKRERVTDDDTVFSGADGKVVAIEEVTENEYFKDRRIQVSVFMSVTNVHVNWYPVGGKVDYYRHHHGSYMVASHPKSSEENERTTTVIDTGKEKILFRQVAGYIARRIVNYSTEGEQVGQNTKCGVIKFGSRIDIFLPTDSEILVSLGDKVVGSRTPIAKLKR